VRDRDGKIVDIVEFEWFLANHVTNKILGIAPDNLPRKRLLK